MKVNAKSEHSNKNRRPGPVNTNWGDKVGICKPRLRTDQGRWIKIGESVPLNTNWGPEPVNTNWRPGPGAKSRARGWEIQIPYKTLLFSNTSRCISIKHTSRCSCEKGQHDVRKNCEDQQKWKEMNLLLPTFKTLACFSGQCRLQRNISRISNYFVS